MEWYDHERERNLKDKARSGIVFHVGKEQHGWSPAED